MADEYGPLFASSSPEPSESEHTYGVLELNEAISAALENAFPGDIWLRGEIQGLARSRGRKHRYFELVEKDEGSDQPRSRVSIALLSWNRPKVDADLKAAPGFELDDDLEVRIRCRVGYYAPWGKLQLTMMGVDPSYTLGKLAQNRERILRQLAAEGLLERNAQRQMPPLPLRVGLITSIGSAAYNDFVQELSRSGYAFALQAIDVRVQGTETESGVVRALRHFAGRRPDVVVLIRGGGSRSDLAAFDSEAIARAIAAMPIPVWTGIGHEIDTSVADFVAHRHFKTPTACAVALNESVGEFEERIEDAWSQLQEAVERMFREWNDRLRLIGRQAGRALRSRLRYEGQRLHDDRRRLDRESRRTLPRRLERLGLQARRLVSLGRDRLRRREQRLAELSQRLPSLAQRPPREESKRLAQFESQLRALDPRRVLRRGYSLSFDADGRLLRSVRDLAAGEQLLTELADGQIASRVESLRPSEDE